MIQNYSAINTSSNVVNFSAKGQENDFDKALGQIIKQIDSAETIAILPHAKSDGDAVGSAAAMKNLIDNYSREKGMQKDVHVYMPDEIADGLKCTEDSENFIYINSTNEDKKYDLVITVDCPTKGYMGKGKSIFDNAKTTALIDHHPGNERYAQINAVKESPSAAQLVMRMADKMKVPINKPMADDIYLGLVTDTVGLNYLGKKPAQTFMDCAKLAEAGADTTGIYTNSLKTMTPNMLKYYQKAIGSIELAEDGKIATLVMDEPAGDPAEKANRNAVMLGITNNILPNIKGVQVAMRISGEANHLTGASLRSKNVDVRGIAEHFNGGGHPQSAGCGLGRTPPVEAKAQLLKYIREANILG